MEIRLKILKYLLVNGFPIHSPRIHGKHFDKGASQPSKGSLAILETCKKFNEEGTEVYYKYNSFILYIPSLISDCKGLVRFAHLRRTTIQHFTNLKFLSYDPPCSASFYSFDEDGETKTIAFPASAICYDNPKNESVTLTGEDIIPLIPDHPEDAIASLRSGITALKLSIEIDRLLTDVKIKKLCADKARWVHMIASTKDENGNVDWPRVMAWSAQQHV